VRASARSLLVGCLALAACGKVEQGDADADVDSDVDTDTDTDTDTEAALDLGLIVSRAALAPSNEGCELTGASGPDNAFAGALEGAGANYVDSSLADGIADGTLLYLLDFDGLDDASGQNDPALGLAFLGGIDSDADAANNVSGGADVYVASTSLDADGNPLIQLSGSVTAGALQAGPGDLAFPVPSADPPFLTLLGTTIAAEVVADADGARVDALAGGRICGVLPISSLASTTFDIGMGQFRMIDVLVLGTVVTTAMQPDVDLDGDGLETLSDADGDGQVDTCVDGGGTTATGAECALNLQDGYSCALDIEGIWVVLLGVRDPDV
jgi:hypothetical protein